VYLLKKMAMGATALTAFVLLSGCGAQPAVNTTANVNTTTNTNTNTSAANTNTNSNSQADAATTVQTREPEQYQATVSIRIEAVGQQQTSTLPPLTAKVARSGNDRRMEFTVPAGGNIVYLDKGGTNFLILPDRRQYAEINRETTGFEIRRMLTPEQIVQQVKNTRGVQLVGDEMYNGRSVTKYRYGSVANTQTAAGQVATESFLYVDKETGLPIRSETMSQSQSGGNVQGFSGVRVVTEITDIQTSVSPEMFQQPADYQRIEPEQVRSQVDLFFRAFGALATQMMQQSQTGGASPPTPAANR
jgi:hypothetical protein